MGPLLCVVQLLPASCPPPWVLEHLLPPAVAPDLLVLPLASPSPDRCPSPGAALWPCRRGGAPAPQAHRGAGSGERSGFLRSGERSHSQSGGRRGRSWTRRSRGRSYLRREGHVPRGARPPLFILQLAGAPLRWPC